jgi:hypothetical protein
MFLEKERMLLGRDGDPIERTTFPLTTNHSWKRKKFTRKADIEGNRKTKHKVRFKTLGRCNITTKVSKPFSPQHSKAAAGAGVGQERNIVPTDGSDSSSHVQIEKAEEGPIISDDPQNRKRCIACPQAEIPPLLCDRPHFLL